MSSGHPAAETQSPAVPDGGRPISFSFVPGLDGLRAIAVLGVMLFHGGAPLVGGGFLGVNMFFVLSGFLITSLLLGEWTKRLTIRLGQFWTRRARRLLPALLLVLVGVAIYAKVFATPGEFADLRLDSLSTLFYVANWHFIFGGSSYFAQTAQPSPLEHMWSLSIEEQFYIVWPPVALVMLRLGRSCDRRRRLWPIFATAVLGAIASAVDMRVSYLGHAAVTRLYEGTDTRCQDILVGASLAIGMAIWAQHRPPLGERAARRPASRTQAVVRRPDHSHRRLGDRLAGGPVPPASPRVVGPGRLPRLVDSGDHLGPHPVRGRLPALRRGRGHGHLLHDHRPDRLPVREPSAIRCSATSGRSPTGPICGTCRSSSSSTPPGSTSTASRSWPCASGSPWSWPPPPSIWWSSRSGGAGCDRSPSGRLG